MSSAVTLPPPCWKARPAMSEIKPVRMWAVYAPDDWPITVRLSAQEAMIAASPYTTWDRVEAKGYRCIRVLVTPLTPDPESEKSDE